MNLQKTSQVGTVKALFAGKSRDDGILKQRILTAKCIAGHGIDSDCHARFTYPSGGRENQTMPRGTDVFNTRQITLATVGEVRQTANNMGLESLDAGVLGVNILLDGIENFTQLRAGTMLVFSGGVQLYLSMQNTPCGAPAKALRETLPEEHKAIANRFVKASTGLRGQLAMVLVAGTIEEGETVEIWQQTYENPL